MILDREWVYERSFLIVKKSTEDLDSVLPVWLHFKPRWYRRLKAIAEECGVTMAEVVSSGVELYLKEFRKTAGSQDKTSQRPRKARVMTGAELVSHRWRKMTREQKSAVGRRMAEKRWHKKDHPDQAA